MNVFVCYPSEHEVQARDIRGFIRSVGLDCWFDKVSLIGGDDWDRVRKEALKRADIVTILCSIETTSRNGIYQREINEALEIAKDKRLGSRYIVPIRLSDIELPSELVRFQYIDYHESRWKRALALALKAAMQENGEQVPANLEVASAEPDEGGVLSQNASENRPNGTIEASWIEYDLDGQYWDFVNGVIRARILGDFFQTRRHIDEWVHGSDWPSGSYSEINLSEFYRKDQLVSLTVGWDSYYAGAAHPNHGLETINIFGEQAGIISASDLFDYSKHSLEFLTEYANQDIRRQSESQEMVWSLDEYVKQSGWDVFEHFSFNAEGMQLNFSSASGLPHVLGFFAVYLPWQHAERYLAPVARKILIGQN